MFEFVICFFSIVFLYWFIPVLFCTQFECCNPYFLSHFHTTILPKCWNYYLCVNVIQFVVFGIYRFSFSLSYYYLLQRWPHFSGRNSNLGLQCYFTPLLFHKQDSFTSCFVRPGFASLTAAVHLPPLVLEHSLAH